MISRVAEALKPSRHQSWITSFGRQDSQSHHLRCQPTWSTPVMNSHLGQISEKNASGGRDYCKTHLNMMWPFFHRMAPCSLSTGRSRDWQVHASTAQSCPVNSGIGNFLRIWSFIYQVLAQRFDSSPPPRESDASDTWCHVIDPRAFMPRCNHAGLWYISAGLPPMTTLVKGTLAFYLRHGWMTLVFKVKKLEISNMMIEVDGIPMKVIGYNRSQS